MYYVCVLGYVRNLDRSCKDPQTIVEVIDMTLDIFAVGLDPNKSASG